VGRRLTPLGCEDVEVSLCREVRLELNINGQSYVTLLGTPGAEKELVLGYLYTEGLFDPREGWPDVRLEERRQGGGLDSVRARIELPGRETPAETELWKAASGHTSRKTPWTGADRRVETPATIPAGVILDALDALRGHQPIYAETRGVHAVSLHRSDGRFLCCFEDVGRHNALDKVIGRGLIEGLPLSRAFVLLSGRASLEMVLKTARAGIPLLCCISSPTAQAVETADMLNVALVKPESGRTLLVYANAWRVVC